MNDDLVTLLGADRQTLLGQWQQAFGRPPPPHIHASFLRLALAYQLQSGRRAGHAAKLSKSRTSPPRSLSPLRPGTRLIREWQGRTYHVLVTEKGFDHQGKHYRSLSAIAREITGTPWSGPAFFGTGR